MGCGHGASVFPDHDAGVPCRESGAAGDLIRVYYFVSIMYGRWNFRGDAVLKKTLFISRSVCYTTYNHVEQ